MGDTNSDWEGVYINGPLDWWYHI